MSSDAASMISTVFLASHGLIPVVGLLFIVMACGKERKTMHAVSITSSSVAHKNSKKTEKRAIASNVTAVSSATNNNNNAKKSKLKQQPKSDVKEEMTQADLGWKEVAVSEYKPKDEVKKREQPKGMGMTKEMAMAREKARIEAKKKEDKKRKESRLHPQASLIGAPAAKVASSDEQVGAALGETQSEGDEEFANLKPRVRDADRAQFIRGTYVYDEGQYKTLAMYPKMDFNDPLEKDKEFFRR